MIDRLKNIFSRQIRNNDTAMKDSPHRDILVATCALLLEMASIDGEFSDDEQRSIISSLKDQYHLLEEDAYDIMDAARKEVAHSIDLWQFTNLINQNYTEDEKVRVIETIWKVVYADGRLEKHEDYLVHQLANLLRLTHSQLIEAKMKVKEQA